MTLRYETSGRPLASSAEDFALISRSRGETSSSLSCSGLKPCLVNVVAALARVLGGDRGPAKWADVDGAAAGNPQQQQQDVDGRGRRLQLDAALRLPPPPPPPPKSHPRDWKRRPEWMPPPVSPWNKKSNEGGGE